MFNNLNWWNVVVLLLLALFIFGDKLPQVISDGLRMLRNLRRMARNATTDLSRELGTDIQLEDLHPKTFIRKHLLSEADQEALVKPLRGLSEDLAREAKGMEQEFKDVSRQVTAPAGGTGDRDGGGAAAANRSGARRMGSTGSGAAAGDASPGLASSPDGSLAGDEALPAPSPRRSYDDIS